MRKYIQPSFEIDHKGRTICREHTLYRFFLLLNNKNPSIDQIKDSISCKECSHYINRECNQFNISNPINCSSHSLNNYLTYLNYPSYYDGIMDNLLRCQTCEHYYKDDCYFPKKIIDRIAFRQSLAKFYYRFAKYRCQLCGAPIHRNITIVQSLYYESVYNTKLPLICCECHQSLNKESFIADSKERGRAAFAGILLFLFLILGMLALIISRFTLSLVFIVLFFSVISIYILSNANYDLRKGREVYNEFNEKIKSHD
jgi:hypothetical protein